MFIFYKKILIKLSVCFFFGGGGQRAFFSFFLSPCPFLDQKITSLNTLFPILAPCPLSDIE